MNTVKSVSEADYRARCFVQGVKRDSKSGEVTPVSGGWHDRFLDHPWVRESIIEGWESDLRMHLVLVVKSRLLGAKDYGDIEGLMPDRNWIKNAKSLAGRYRAAEAAREGERSGGTHVAKVLSEASRRMTGDR